MGALPAILGKAFISFITNLVMSMAGEKFIEWFFFLVADKFAKSTKTKVDDAFIAKMKESYDSYMENK